MTEIDFLTVVAIAFVVIMTIVLIIAIKKVPSKHYSIVS